MQHLVLKERYYIFCEASQLVLPTSWRGLVDLFISHMFPEFEEHAMAADKK